MYTRCQSYGPGHVLHLTLTCPLVPVRIQLEKQKLPKTDSKRFIVIGHDVILALKRLVQGQPGPPREGRNQGVYGGIVRGRFTLWQGSLGQPELIGQA